MPIVHRPIPRSLLFLALSSPAWAQGASNLFTEGLVVGDERDRFEGVLDLDGDGVLDAWGWYWEDDEFDRLRVNATFFEEGGAISAIETLVTPVIRDGLSEHATGIGDPAGTGEPQMIVMLEGHVARIAANCRGELSFVDWFPTQFGHSAPNYDRGVLVEDFTGDGVDDFIVAGPYRMELWTVVNGSPQYLDTAVWGTGHSEFRFAAADMDGDGALDVVAVHHHYSAGYDTTLSVFQVAHGAFGAQTSWTFSLAGQKHVVAGDVDGDGDADAVVFGHSYPSRYRVLRRTGPASHQLEPSRQGGPATDLADVDGDDDLDGVCCSGGGGGGPGGPPTNLEPAEFMVTLNDGTGSFDDAVAFPGLGAEHIAGTLDFDADGDLDLLAGRAVLLNTTATGRSYCRAEANSTGAPAELAASGSASTLRNELVLTATGVPPGQFGLGFFGFEQGHNPLGAGVLCVRGSFHRLPVVQTDPTGSLVEPLDLNAFPGSVITAGDVVDFQMWFRDGAGSNLTNGLQVLFHP